MATLAVLGQQFFTFDGVSFSVTKVQSASSSDTVTVPRGVLSASALGTSDLAVSASAGADEDTLTITGGSASSGIAYVVARHTGSQAGMGA